MFGPFFVIYVLIKDCPYENGKACEKEVEEYYIIILIYGLNTPGIVPTEKKLWKYEYGVFIKEVEYHV